MAQLNRVAAICAAVLVFLWWRRPRKGTIPLGGTDAIWLSDDADLSLVVHCIMEFDGPQTHSALIDLTSNRMNEPRFRMKAVRSSWFTRPYFVPCPDFDVQNHIKTLSLPEPADQATLQKIVSEMFNKPLTLDKPLWDLYNFDNYVGDGGAPRSVWLFRFHHCLADGIAALHFMMRADDNIFEKIQLQKSEKETKQQPRQTPKSQITWMQKLSYLPKVIATIFYLLSVRRDPPSIFFPRERVRHRTLDWSSKTYSVDTIKSIKTKLGQNATVNDVLIAAAAGSFRRFMLERGGNSEALKAVVWVNLREMVKDFTRDITWGNNLGTVFIKFPIEIADPVARVRNISEQVAVLRKSPEPLVASGMMKIFGDIAPPFFTNLLWNSSAYKASFSLSNVPGPQYACHMKGRKLNRLMFFVPPVGFLGIFVCILSYNGEIGSVCFANCF
eukprot:TRINITY_DN1355_c0_g1_i11.p1 TRINITY_DN1355_c0_g1~~TRINITY_DN1355_c0_g1_i11.p1  ORF type:complete len:443 (-),score=87.67 TRINITY_DN1355_c0_g1_i11:892-2220(-)